MRLLEIGWDGGRGVGKVRGKMKAVREGEMYQGGLEKAHAHQKCSVVWKRGFFVLESIECPAFLGHFGRNATSCCTMYSLHSGCPDACKTGQPLELVFLTNTMASLGIPRYSSRIRARG